jgi:putative DNA primase/helicase
MPSSIPESGTPGHDEIAGTNRLPPVLEASVSLFDGSTNTTPIETVPLATVLQRIRAGAYRPYVEHLRHVLTTQGQKAYKAAKERSTAFTPCCALTTRDKDTAWSTKLITCTGLVHLDLDGLDDPEGLKADLARHGAVVFAFVSPRGDGLKIGMAATGITDPESYKHAWNVVTELIHRDYPTVTINVDAHIKYLNALCYMSYDPAVHVNADAIPLVIPPPARKKPPAPRRLDDTPDYATVASALFAIPNNDADYETWLTIGMALHSTGEGWARGLWDNWSQHSGKYDEGKQGKSWRSFTADGKTTIGTLFHCATQHGWRPPRALPPVERNGTTPPRGAAPVHDVHEADPPLPLSDYTNALAFVRDHHTDVRYLESWGKWLHWTGTHWDCEVQGPIMQRAKDTIKRLLRQCEALEGERLEQWMKHIKASLNKGKLEAMIALAQDEPRVDIRLAALNTAPWLLPCANGTLDLRTGNLREAQRSDYLTAALTTAYDPTATCPVFEAFLWRIMGGRVVNEDADALRGEELEQYEAQNALARSFVDFLQRVFGQCLSGDVSEQDLYILYGTGANGKSTLINTLLALLGSYAMKASGELLMTTRSDRHPTERADLFGKRLVATIETQEAGRLNESFVKEATGGDPIRARRMREDFWEFLPTHKMLLATNHKPEIRGMDHAIWRRIKLIPFTVTIPEAEQDKALPTTLLHELPGILAWMVRGCLDWRAGGLRPPQEVLLATEAYRQEQDVFEAFLATECFRTPNARVSAAEIYQTYEQWCGNNDIEPINKRAFGQRLGDCGCTPHQGTGGRREWVGVGLPAPSTEAARHGN